MSDNRPALWPGVIIATSAFVAVYSGWVGMGEMTGYGPVKPFPGIYDNFEINTAITLPLGMEAYGAWAAYVWLHPKTPKSAQVFAGLSALTALILGAMGQVAFHLLKTNGYKTAPDEVVIFVSVLPVAVAGLAMVLVHMITRAGLGAEILLPKIKLPRIGRPRLRADRVQTKVATEKSAVVNAPPPAASPDPAHPKLPPRPTLRAVPTGDVQLSSKLTPSQQARVIELLPQARKLENQTGKSIQTTLKINTAVASELARLLREDRKSRGDHENKVG